jgi:peptide deformylase
MAIMPILQYPDPRLRRQAEPVADFDESLKNLAADMGETMLEAPGAGLAAPQVAVLKRLIVIAGAGNDEDFDDRVLTLINPEIVRAEGEQLYDEGCLSLLDLRDRVLRAAEITVVYQDLEGRRQEMAASGRRAVILQHEIDHLDGVLFMDRLSPLKRSIYKRKIKKNLKAAAGD